VEANAGWTAGVSGLTVINMTINYKVLGEAGQDNVLLVSIDSGQNITRLLFDCGDECLTGIKTSEILAIDHLFFSHLHMDHVAGFDLFFRLTYNRDTRPNAIWGPPETARIMQNRFRAFMWNLHGGQPGTWRVSDIHTDRVKAYRYEIADGFETCYDGGERPNTRIIVDDADYTVEALTMDHLTPSIAYIVKEKTRFNIDTGKMSEMGLKPGPWLKQIKDDLPDDITIKVGDTEFELGKLREVLLVETPGESVAYLTDFLLDDDAMKKLSAELQGCNTVVCEAQYRHTDLELSRQNYHMTTLLSAELAKRADVEKLVLFHLSSRYVASEWLEMLEEARSIFPNTFLPDHWRVGI
jgi:ribonuclease Z